MKAILKVKKGSIYSMYNGLTFRVVQLMSNIIALDIDGKTTDFSFGEVIIVYIDGEYLNSEQLKREKLLKYCQENKVHCSYI